MADYKNIGSVSGETAAQVAVSPEIRTQVYKATHNSQDRRLTYMHRSFISFSFGGVQIEDLGVIATTSDRLNRQLSASFEDLVTDYDVVNGQYYWGTRYTANQLDLTLSTDRITQNQLEDLARLFRGGNTQELILAEHPNRGIYARVAAAPVMSVYPFEERVQAMILGQSYNTSTTVYRGDIHVSLIMDEPHWHSISNILLTKVKNSNSESVNTLTDEDTLKIILEDNVPYYKMLEQKTYVGTGIYSSASTSRAASQALPENDEAYLYYGGNAPATTKISFAFVPRFNKQNSVSEPLTGVVGAYIGTAQIGMSYIGDQRNTADLSRNSSFYIMEPRNKLYETVIDGNKHVPYNYIQIGSKEFRFTTPTIFTSYNSALDTVRAYTNGGSVADILLDIRNSVSNYYVRAFAANVINYLATYTDFGTGNKTMLLGEYSDMSLWYVFSKCMWMFLVGPTGTARACTVTFDSKDGTATGSFPVYRVNSTNYKNKVTDDIFTSFGKNLRTVTYAENIGNMVYDKYFILDEQTKPNLNGTIAADDCLKVTTDYTGGLTKVSIDYKNMYL